jgi:hypothetical protein
LAIIRKKERQMIINDSCITQFNTLGAVFVSITRFGTDILYQRLQKRALARADLVRRYHCQRRNKHIFSERFSEGRRAVSYGDDPA